MMMANDGLQVSYAPRRPLFQIKEEISPIH